MFSFCFISYISGSIIGHLGGNPFYYTVYSKSWTRNLGRTRNTRPGTLIIHGIQKISPGTQFISGTRDPRPRTLQVGQGNREPGPISYIGPKTRGKLKVGPGTLHLRLRTLVIGGTQDQRSLSGPKK